MDLGPAPGQGKRGDRLGPRAFRGLPISPKGLKRVMKSVTRWCVTS